jgi:predicted permease
MLRLARFYFRLTVDLLGRIRPERVRSSRRDATGLGTPGTPYRGSYQSSLSQTFERIARDIRMAMRSLRRRPVFLLVASLSLTLGIGANSAIFSAVNAFFIRQYPFRAPEQLVRVYTSIPGRTEYGTTSFPNFSDMSEYDAAFHEVGAFKTIFTRMELPDQTLRVMGEGVSHTLFPMLGVDAAVGRTFSPEEDETPGAHPVMMLGHGFWQRAFGGDPTVLGRTIRLAGQPFTVVGITPEGFRGLTGPGLVADFFVPLVMYPTATGLADQTHFQDRLDRRYYVVARLTQGMTPQRTQAALGILSHQIRQANPEIEQEWVFATVPLEDVALGPEIDRAVLPFAAILMTACGLVLILACINLASFLLARTTERRTEIAMRLALGAGRGTLVRQLLTETVLLALLGGAAGLLLAHWLLGLVTQLQPALPVSITLDLALDRNVLLFTIGMSALAGALLGLAPALQCTTPALAPTLRGETVQGRKRHFGLRRSLVAIQMALSVVLLVGGGLFVRSLAAARRADLGFSTRKAGIAWVDLSLSDIPPAQYRTVTRELAERVRALPGIEAATAASHIPFFGSASGGFYSIPDADPPADGRGHNVEREEVAAAFFETMGIPLVAGRSFSQEDGSGSPPVAIVNEAAARLFWPGLSPLGREFSPIGSNRTVSVVGVVGNTRFEGLRGAYKPLFYFPIAQQPDPDLILVARGQFPSDEIAAMLRRAIRDLNPSLMVMETITMEENIGLVLFPARMTALVLGVFGVLALMLATIGLYGVVSFSVSQRTREMGIRMSLGADAGSVIRLVMKGALSLVVIGGTAGLAGALALARLLRHLLYEVGPWDPMTILGVPLLLGCVAAVAALIPARRASRVDPVRALKYE